LEASVRNLANDPDRPVDWKDQQEVFSQTASHFMVMKNAWRNYTAHAHGFFGEEEAENIMTNIRAVMQKPAAEGLQE